MTLTRYLGQVAFTEALKEQSAIVQRLSANETERGCLLGFEPLHPVITLGQRGSTESDLKVSEDNLKQKGVEVLKVDRGGQATLHNPGQLVVFPIVKLGDLRPKDWVCRLSQVTRQLLAQHGVSAVYQEVPTGLYVQASTVASAAGDAQGKIAAFGLRIHSGVSTHGLALNVANALADFEWIRSCGEDQPKLARLQDFSANGALDLKRLFAGWCEIFQANELGRTVDNSHPATAGCGFKD